MMQIITVGKPSSPWLRDACEDYTKRLVGRWSVRWVVIPPSQHATPALRMRQEGERIVAALSAKSMVILLDRVGRQMDSEGWAKTLVDAPAQGVNPAVSWVIGGSDGVSDQVIQAAQHRWSMSELTFPHALVRLLLVEQIYRCWSIVHDHPYHK